MKKFVNFLSDEFNLEGVFYTPKAAGMYPAAIVVHPHPQFGGSMDNNVVDAVCEELENSIIALKFNCRGVGRSEGNSSGEKEMGRDVTAAINFLKTTELAQVDQKRIAFIGYSWGTYIGLPVTYKNPDIKLLVGISSPVGLWNFNYLKEADKPKLLTVGLHDSFAPIEKVKDLFNKLPDPKELFSLNTDHFWVGHEKALATKVSEFLHKFL